MFAELSTGLGILLQSQRAEQEIRRFPESSATQSHALHFRKFSKGHCSYEKEISGIREGFVLCDTPL